MVKIGKNASNKWARFLADKLGNFALACSSILVGIYFLILFSQVLSRFIFGHSFPWAEEAALYFNVWAVMLAGSVLIWRNELIRVDFFDSFWPQKFIKTRDKAFSALLVVILSILFWHGLTQAFFGRNTFLTSIKVSMFWPYLAVPVGVSFMLLQYFFAIFTSRDREKNQEFNK